MPARRDVENGTTPDEREPLLARASPQDPANRPSEADDATLSDQEESTKRRAYGWRGFWIVVAILIIAVFVKGWIEADDVDVSNAQAANLPFLELI